MHKIAKTLTMARSIPRNIDRPERTPEYVIAFAFGYELWAILFKEPIVGLAVGIICLYVYHQAVKDKPEVEKNTQGSKRNPDQ